jgi:ribosomal protein L5
MLVGCKNTLRKTNLDNFLETLSITLPRMEKIKKESPSFLQKFKENSFNFIIRELIFFYQIELGLGVNTDVKKFNTNFIFNNYSFEEKIFSLSINKIPLNF